MYCLTYVLPFFKFELCNLCNIVDQQVQKRVQLLQLSTFVFINRSTCFLSLRFSKPLGPARPGTSPGGRSRLEAVLADVGDQKDRNKRQIIGDLGHVWSNMHIFEHFETQQH